MKLAPAYELWDKKLKKVNAAPLYIYIAIEYAIYIPKSTDSPFWLITKQKHLNTGVEKG